MAPLTSSGQVPTPVLSGNRPGHAEKSGRAPVNHQENTMNDQIDTLESYCPDSRVHAMINNPETEGIDEG